MGGGDAASMGLEGLVSKHRESSYRGGRSPRWIKVKNRQASGVQPGDGSVLMPIRLIRHEAVPQSGSYEVRFADRRESRFFYFDDVLARRLRPDMFTSDQALEQAKAFARAERDKA
jgi:hypothetical protein